MNKKNKNLFILLFAFILIIIVLSAMILTFKGSTYKLIFTVINILFFSLIIISTISFALVKFAKNNNYYILMKLLKKIVLPLIILIFDGLKLESIEYKQFYISINNKLVLRSGRKYNSSEILILMPHCLQNSECLYNISHNLENCKECGKCDINDLKMIFKEKKVSLTVATGGTAARNSVLNFRPRFIIASACERDLFSGLYEIKKVPTYGIINDRPNGPCKDTKIDIKELKEVLALVME